MTAPDAALIARTLASDDRAAFGELVLRHQSAVRRFLRSLANGDLALADDLAQDTFVQAYKSLRQFRSEAAFSTWLLGIAHNHWRNARRKKRPTPVADLPDRADEAPPLSRSVALKEDLAAALSRLSAEERTALHLCCQQGLSHTEASAITGSPVGTIKTHLLRSKEKLRHLLAVWNPQT